jgi:alpha 1,2-mannosyltransferase
MLLAGNTTASPRWRNLLIAAIFLIITVFLVHRNTSTIAKLSVHDLLPSSCASSTRASARYIVPPAPANTHFLKSYWRHTESLFDDHPPTPSRLPHYDPWGLQKEEGTGYPTKESLNSLLNITDDDANSTRQAHAAVLYDLPLYPEDQFNGRGIVMLGGGTYSQYAATSLGVLRELGSTLPVEVWVTNGTEEIAGWCQELEAEGMSCRRLSDFMDTSVLENAYQMKVFTILFSSFKDVFFLDADSIPLKAPDDIFDSDLYLEVGAVVWPDYWANTASDRLRYIIGDTDEMHDESWLLNNRTVDSGQILWNKQQHWKSLLLATYYNYYGKRFYYYLLNNGWSGWGDKDTFAAALIATEEPWYQVPQGIHTLWLYDVDLFGLAMLQTDPRSQEPMSPQGWSPSPFVMHANTCKWSINHFFGRADQEQPVSDQHISEHPHRKAPYYENEAALAHKSLRDGQRLLKTESYEFLGVDPEILLWKAMEHTACRSKAWGEADTCTRTRNHMVRTFGFGFVKDTGMRAKIYDHDEFCIVDP